MEIVLIIIAVIIGLILSWNNSIEDKRQIAFNNIEVYYDQMQMYVLSKHITPTNEVLEYLKSFKEFKVNNQLADFRILVGILITADKEKMERSIRYQQERNKKLPAELLQYGNLISREVNQSIYLSTFKPNVLPVILYKIAKVGLVSLVERKLATFNGFFDNLKRTFNKSNDVECYGHQLVLG